MKNFLLSIAFIYGIGMSLYGADWYFKDMNQLEASIVSGNSKIELRHRINTWGNVMTILFGNTISVIALTGFSRQSNTCSQRDDH